MHAKMCVGFRRIIWIGLWCQAMFEPHPTHNCYRCCLTSPLAFLPVEFRHAEELESSPKPPKITATEL